MKCMRNMLAMVMGLLMLSLAMAQNYPVNNPTYIPTASLSATVLSAPGNVVFNSNGVAVATLRTTGTCTALADSVQGSNDYGANWTTLNAVSVAEGSNSYAPGIGFWKIESGGFNQLRVHITALSASCTFSMAGTPSGSVKADPCSDPAILKSSVVLNSSSSTTTSLVATSGSTNIFVCSLSATLVGTSPSFTLEYGTSASTACDTGATALTGVFVPSATVGGVNFGGNYTVLQAGAGKALCSVTGATTSLQGVLTYVQQ